RRGDDEHRSTDDGEPQAALQNLGDGHYGSAPGGVFDVFLSLWRTPLRRTRSGTIMQFDTLLFERRDAIAHVSLNRPDRLNALNRALITDLTSAAAAIDSERNIRAVVLTAVGRAFCSGADLMGDDLLGDPTRSRGANIAA